MQGWGDTRKHAGKSPCLSNRHQMYIHGKHSYQQAPISRSLGVHVRRERAHLIDGVWVILNRTRPHVQTARFGMTQTISYLLYRLILCIMDLIVFAECFTRTHTHTHARTTVKSALFSHLMSSRSITVLRMLSII